MISRYQLFVSYTLGCKAQLDPYQHLMGLDLNSSFPQTDNQDDGVTDILIGSDYYDEKLLWEKSYEEIVGQ